MLWEKSLIIGIKRSDKQNRELFRRIEMLLDVAEKDKTLQMLDLFEDYLQRHFDDEEILHKASGYPKAIEHRKCHEDYVKKLYSFKEQVKTNDLETSAKDEVNRKIVVWVKDHIVNDDRQFASYMHTKGNRA